MWRHKLRPQVLAASNGVCAICGATICPHCHKAACGGSIPPGQVHHVNDWAVYPHLREHIGNLVAAHGCCNRRVDRPNGYTNPRW